MKKNTGAEYTLLQAFIVSTAAYICALLAAIGTGFLFKALHPVPLALIADFSATCVIYLFGRIFRNSSLYDPYWSLSPMVIVVFWLLRSASGNAVPARQILVSGLVFIWGLRLTYNWVRQWRGLKHEDWRYQKLREKFPRWFWLVDLVGIEIMPTIIVFMGCLPLFPALSAGKNGFGILDVAAVIITGGAVLIETAADEQLLRFTLKKQQPGEIMSRGLWAYSRHPNYFGEIMFWWGLFMFGLAADSSYWWTVIGPVSVTALFFGISIPLMEKRNLARRPGYAQLRKQISGLVPWFPRRM